MRRCSFAFAALIVGSFVFSNTDSVRAGWPFHRHVVPPTPETIGNAPTATRYQVVVPRSLPVTVRPGIQTPDVVWEQHRVVMPTYPWGWFGARETPQSWAHTSYYGNSYSIKALRQN